MLKDYLIKFEAIFFSDCRYKVSALSSLFSERKCPQETLF